METFLKILIHALHVIFEFLCGICHTGEHEQEGEANGKEDEIGIGE